MDPATFTTWLQERIESDNEIDEVIAQHVLLLANKVDDDNDVQAILNRMHGGSRPGRASNLFRDHEDGHRRIMRDYFDESPTYPSHVFRQRWRMRKSLFLRIHDQLLRTCPYFVQRPNAVGRPGLSSIQKMTAAMRMFTLGIAGDAVDEYVRIGESTAIEAFKEFAMGIVNNFGDEYLRGPTEEDVRKHLEINGDRGFVGMFGSLDCCHWVWKNCPVGLQGQFRNKDGDSTLVLKAIASKNLWIWHAFIGIPGSNNDINVVDRSPLIVNLLQGVAPNVGFEVNGNKYPMFYLLTDGIYPDYSIFVKTINDPIGNKRKLFALKQEGCRKDVERAFGVLHARFHVVANPSRLWSFQTMSTVWRAAIIMHNMVVEDEEGHPNLNQDYLFENQRDLVILVQQRPLTFDMLKKAMDRVKDYSIHSQLQEDLVEHLWQVKGNIDT